MIGYSDLKWKNEKLYHGTKFTSIYLTKDENYKKQYWIHWNFEKPEKSINFYNLMNAHDNGKKLYLGYANNDTENRP